MGNRKNNKHGFPGGCPLPDKLADEVLKQTTRSKRACTVCKDVGSLTEEYRGRCHWLDRVVRAFGG
jgi:hypothetical protein